MGIEFDASLVRRLTDEEIIWIKDNWDACTQCKHQLIFHSNDPNNDFCRVTDCGC